MKDRIKKAFADHRKMLEGLSSQIVDDIEKGAQNISRVLEQGNKILIMGNGGSAADAQHMAAEFVGRFLQERRALPAVALTTDTSILTALGNDYGYEKIFERQIEALAKKGDLVIGISTSGKSDNVMIALERAIELGCTTMGLTGELGGPIAKIVDLNLYVPSKDTPRIQEGHVMIIHILCDLVEQDIL